MTIGNGTQLPILHTVTKIFQFPSKVFQLKRVLHAPHLATNLVSVSQFYVDNNTFVEFHPQFFFVKEQVTKKVLLEGHLERGLYKFPTIFSSSTDCLFFNFNNSSFSNSTTELWHSRLGHPAEDIFWNMLSTIVISLINIINSKFVVSTNMPKVTSYHFRCLCQEHLIL